MSDPSDPQEFLARARKLARAAIALWDIEPGDIDPIKVRENAVFRVTGPQGRAVLRVHRHGYHSDAALLSEFAWMRALESAGIAVPQVIPSRSGRDFERVEIAELPGPRQVDVLRWIDGRQLGSVEASLEGTSSFDADQYRTIGAIMARMHNQAAAWTIPLGFVRHRWDLEGLVGDHPLWGRFWELDALEEHQRRLLIAARAAVAHELEEFGTAADRYGLIHADLVPENVLVDDSNVRIIDFDDAGFGWHLFDIATSLYFVTGDANFRAARSALVEGYRSERALPEEMLDRLDTFLTARATTYLGWVHTRRGTETARDLTPFLVERACTVAERWLAAR
jgi:Ser/Thr protein kinase RdoA (MazF antagonist)